MVRGVKSADIGGGFSILGGFLRGVFTRASVDFGPCSKLPLSFHSLKLNTNKVDFRNYNF